VLTIQIRYRLFKTLEFLRYELWKEILSELLDAEQFWQSLGAFKLLSSLVVLQVFTHLYKVVKWTLWIANTSKKSRLKLWSITNDLLPDMVIVLWRINFKCIPCMKKHCCRQSCYPCSRDKVCVVEVVVVHFVQVYFVNALQKNKHQMPLNPFELTVVPLFHSSAMFRR